MNDKNNETNNTYTKQELEYDNYMSAVVRMHNGKAPLIYHDSPFEKNSKKIVKRERFRETHNSDDSGDDLIFNLDM